MAAKTMRTGAGYSSEEVPVIKTVEGIDIGFDPKDNKFVANLGGQWARRGKIEDLEKHITRLRSRPVKVINVGRGQPTENPEIKELASYDERKMQWRLADGSLHYSGGAMFLYTPELEQKIKEFGARIVEARRVRIEMERDWDKLLKEGQHINPQNFKEFKERLRSEDVPPLPEEEDANALV